ncbi:hypothetical protein ACF3MZ_07210 [Paenibacillaceae bacterium WGS1546]|uniref:hypothetical protein n=1 Tax=Cohnella sp. WGS1546 TaxID=3366810 RepID=UPI00372D11B7
MIYGVKLLQYVCLLLVALVLGVALSEDANAILIAIAFILFVLNLKWISRYPVSFIGMRCINGLLTMLSFVIIIKIAVAIAGTTSFDLVPGLLIGAVAISPVFLWWNVNVLDLFRRRSKK